MMRKTYSAINLNMLLTNYIRVLDHCSVQSEILPKSLLLQTAQLSELVRLYVPPHCSIFTYLNLGRFAPKLPKKPERSLQDHLIQFTLDNIFLLNQLQRVKRVHSLIFAPKHKKI